MTLFIIIVSILTLLQILLNVFFFRYLSGLYNVVKELVDVLRKFTMLQKDRTGDTK